MYADNVIEKGHASQGSSLQEGERSIGEVIEEGRGTSCCIGVVVEEDEQEKDFNESVEEWAKGEISYQSLMEKLPEGAKPTSSRLANFFLSLVSKLPRSR